MRNAFINRLTELAHTHEDVFLLCGDLGYSVLEPFAERFPDRFLNVGVAEQHMTEMAVGLALDGFNVFTYSIGNFPTLRALEQVRYDVCYHNASVKIVAVGAGYAYGPQGVSHHATEDVAALRAIPGMLVTSPADAIEAAALADFMVARRGPGYIRLNKTGEALVHVTPLEPLSPGSLLMVRDGEGTAVISCGAITGLAAAELQDSDLPYALFSSPFIGASTLQHLRPLLDRFQDLITLEEHQRAGGFGSSVIEVLSDAYARRDIARMPRVRRIAIADQFLSVAGSQEFLRRQAGLTLLGSGE